MVKSAKLDVSVTADTAAATKNIDKFSASFDDVENKAKAATKEVDKVSRSAGEMGEKLDGVGSTSAQAAGGLGDLGGALSTMPGPLGKVGAGMELLAPLIQGLTGATDLLTIGTQGTTAAQTENTAVTLRQRAATIASSAAAKAAAAAQWVWNLAVSAFPILLIIIALVAVGVAVFKFRDQIIGAFLAAWDFIKGLWDQLTGFLATWGPIALAVLVPFIGIPLLIFQHFDQIKGFLGQAFSNALGTVTGFVGDAVGAITGLPGRILSALGEFSSAGAQLLGSLFEGFASAGVKAAGFATDIASKIWDKIKDTFNSAIDGIKNFEVGAFGVNVKPFKFLPSLAGAGGLGGFGGGGTINVTTQPSFVISIGGVEIRDFVVREVKTENRKFATRLAGRVI